MPMPACRSLRGGEEPGCWVRNDTWFRPAHARAPWLGHVRGVLRGHCPDSCFLEKAGNITNSEWTAVRETVGTYCAP